MRRLRDVVAPGDTGGKVYNVTPLPFARFRAIQSTWAKTVSDIRAISNSFCVLSRSSIARQANVPIKLRAR